MIVRRTLSSSINGSCCSSRVRVRILFTCPYFVASSSVMYYNAHSYTSTQQQQQQQRGVSKLSAALFNMLLSFNNHSTRRALLHSPPTAGFDCFPQHNTRPPSPPFHCAAQHELSKMPLHGQRWFISGM